MPNARIRILAAFVAGGGLLVGCGDSAPNAGGRVDVLERVDGRPVAEISEFGFDADDPDVRIAPGRAAYLVSGRASSGSILSYEVDPSEGWVVAKPIELKTGFDLLSPAAVEQPDGHWLIAAVGCASSQGSGCERSVAVIFDGDPTTGHAEEVARIDTQGASLNWAGTVDEEQAVLEVTTAQTPSGDLGEDAVTTITTAFYLVNTSDRSVAKLSWSPEPYSHPVVHTTGSAPMPTRRSCVADRTLHVLDVHPDGTVEASFAPVDKSGDPSRVRVVRLEVTGAPNQLICGERPTVISTDAEAHSATAATLTSDGELVDAQTTNWDDANDLVGVQSSHSSTVVMAGPTVSYDDFERVGPQSGSPEEAVRNVLDGLGNNQGLVFAGRWIDVPDLSSGAAPYPSGDGQTLLLVSAGRLEGVEL